MRVALHIGIVAAAVSLGGCTLAPSENESMTIPECMRDLSEGFRGGVTVVDPDVAKHISALRLEAAVEETCRGLVAPGAQHGENESSDTWMARIRYQRPEILLPLCQVVLDANLKADAHTLRFATRAERSRYRTQHCRLAARYLETETTSVDKAASAAARMTAENAAVYIPICASGAQHGMSKRRSSFTRAQIQLIARRSCAQAIKTGVLTYGIPGLVNARFDGARWGIIVDRTASDIAATTPDG